MSVTLSTSIDNAGRLVIPKALRDELSIGAGDRLTVRVRDGRLEIEPAIVAAHVEVVDGLPVIVHDVDIPPMTADEVRLVLESIRR
ncbi:MAG: AbrB/MazE/SpoVT family DNA-binding domain-containing protein [Ilumatobacteraceae bacterium]